MNRRSARHLLAYPLAYAGAVHARLELRRNASLTPAEALAFSRRFRWRYGSHLSPTQHDREILSLLELLAKRPPRTVVEIGTDEGGTLFLWSRVAAPDALLVAIDSRPLGLLGRSSAWALVRRGIARSRQRVELLMPRDSHESATVSEVRELLGGRKADFLFIDGDHSYEGVKRDFELFAPLVSPDGLIALHDVNEERHEGVRRFWAELRATRETEELFANDPPRTFGIGVVRPLPTAPTTAAG